MDMRAVPTPNIGQKADADVMTKNESQRKTLNKIIFDPG